MVCSLDSENDIYDCVREREIGIMVSGVTHQHNCFNDLFFGYELVVKMIFVIAF